MPISKLIALIVAFYGVAGLAAPALALDGTPNSEERITPESFKSSIEALRSGTRLLMKGEIREGVVRLEYAASQGHPAALWKLGRMYADGEGVTQNDLKAFDYFSRIANANADQNPDGPNARFVASAFVSLGLYYVEGIPNTQVKPDPERARALFAHAATYFRDADAQYNLARMYLDGTGIPKDTRQAVRWLVLSANKSHYRAQAVLGDLLFRGTPGIPRQAARGLMWLTLARDAAQTPEDAWIGGLYDAAFSAAREEERTQALGLIEQWLKNRRG